MKTDISRNTFRADQNYSAVRRQQGRVDLDADWNEQVDIQNHRNRLLTVDALGPVGAPADDSGFAISVSDDALDLKISAGRFYIDGLLIQNTGEYNFSAQPGLPGATLPVIDGNYLAYLKVHERAVTVLEDPFIREIALGGPDTTTRTKVIQQVHLQSIAAGEIDARTVPSEWNDLTMRNPGLLAVRTQADDSGTDPCSIGARGGYTGLDNLLYRVEIHDAGPAGSATYKWSRDNGSLVTEWLEQDGNTLTLRTIGNDNVLNFAPGQWVELIDDGMELEGSPGTLVQVLRVEGRRININPDNIHHFPGASGGLDITQFNRGVRKARRWDVVGPMAPPLVPDANAWSTLENGIEIKFDDSTSGRTYQTGDYWMIPARADNNNIQWQCNSQGGIEHAPHGTHFHFARLAFVNLTAGAWSVIADAREIFAGLTNEELAYVGGDGQLSLPGQALERPLEVRATRGAVPLIDAKVRFTATRGSIEDIPGGTASTTLDIKSDNEGIARVYWTLPDSVSGQSVRAVLLDEGGSETPLYVVFGAGSGTASGIQYAPLSPDDSTTGTTNVQEALDALADKKVNRAGDTITGDLEIQGNFTVRGDVIVRDAQQQAGDILLGDDDIDRVVIHGSLESNHTSGALKVRAPVHMRTTDPGQSPLRVDGPTTGGSSRLYRLPLELEHADASAVTLNDYQLLVTVDTATPIAAGRMQADGADILFEDSTGSLLPFWIESDINTAATRIWVRVPTIPAGTNTAISMLYGNANAGAQSSSAATFLREIDGLAAAYHLDESSGTTLSDLSSNNVDAALAGANPPVTATGLFGNCLDFSGSDAHANTVARNWGFSTTATISAWINTTTSNPLETIASIAHTDYRDELLLGLADGRVVIQNHSQGGNYNWYRSDTAVHTGQWTHVLGIIEGGTAADNFRIYINGVEDSATYQVVGSPTPITDTTPRSLYLGTRPIATQNFFHGQLDEIRVYARALNDAEIADAAQGYGYLSPAAKPGIEMIRRFAAIEPVVTNGSEEANPISESPILFAQETSGNIGIGTDSPSEKLSVDGIIETKTGGIKFPDGTIQTTAGGAGGSGGEPLPLGTIMAWHRDFAGTPAVPEGWVECNGQVLNDADSPYDGLVIPNLNGEKRFLRGGDASGNLEQDQFQGHRHLIHRDVGEVQAMDYANGPAGGDGGFIQHGNPAYGRNVGFYVGSPYSDGFNGAPRTGNETRPVNMSVVWIMKIKETGESGLWTPNSEGVHYSSGKVSVGTNVADEQLTVTGAISIEEKILEPNTTDDFGKIYVRENDLSHLRLNGTDQYVSMPALGGDPIGDFTIAVWYRMRKPNPAANKQNDILDLRGDGTYSTEGALLRLITQPDGQTTTEYASSFAGGGGSNFFKFLGNIVGEWHHASIVRQGSEMRVYHDGRLLSDEPDDNAPTSAPMDWNHPWRVGVFHAGTSGTNFLNGDLDDLGLWTRALSHDEIATLHNSGRGSDVPAAFASSLLAFYPMSVSNTPGRLDDVSGNNFHGTIQNGAAVIPERVGSLYFKDGFGNVTALAGGGDTYRTGGSGNQVPLGTIMAWHKSFTNTPAIHDGWVECDGQQLDDPASPYHGQTVPDLNNPKESWNSKGSFLRGDNSSGNFEYDTLQGHIHQVYPHAGTTTGEFPINATGAHGGDTTTHVAASITSSPVPPPIPTSYGAPRTGAETRAANMSVVWIMKVRETDRDRGLWREQGQDIYFDDGNVGVGAKTANAKLHISASDLEEAPLRVDAKITLEGVQGRLYRSAIELENIDSVDLVDHQIPLTVDTAALVSAGKMRFDGADVLFTAGDGKTLLPFFIERDMNTANTRLWVRVPKIVAGETTNIFLQYGKQDATSLASPSATFARALKGLVLAWDFEEGSGSNLNDLSGMDISGSTNGTWTTGYRGNALAYNGTQASTSVGRNWGFTTTGTISAWVRTSQLSAGNFNTIASLKRNTYNDEFLLGVAHTGQLQVMNHNDGGVYTLKRSTSSALTGTWTHVVGVLDGGIGEQNMRVYVNGVREEGTYTVSGSPVPISDALPRTFNVGNRGTGENFIGDIDQVRLFNRALSDQEVAALHTNQTLLAQHTAPGQELFYKALAVPPSITFAPEEPNPVSGAPVLFAQNLTGNIGIGTDEPAAKLHIAGEAGVDGIMFPDGSIQTTAGGPGGGGDSTPLGTIIAWHKDMNGTPAIPQGWVECNGQTLDDEGSPFHEQVIPNLNGDGRFLRGGDTSGTLQEDAFEDHDHYLVSDQSAIRLIIQNAAGTEHTASGTWSSTVKTKTAEAASGKTSDETRPVNMSVVWIMKVRETDRDRGLWREQGEDIYFDGGKVGVGTSSPNFELDVNGTIQCASLVQTSDMRRKKNVGTVEGALSIVDRLRGVRFEWNDSGAGGFSPPHGPQVGLIAQEVESVLPEVVTTDRNGYKAVEYGKLVAILIEAIKELKDKR